jgi:hypothetical protein
LTDGSASTDIDRRIPFDNRFVAQASRSPTSGYVPARTLHRRLRYRRGWNRSFLSPNARCADANSHQRSTCRPPNPAWPHAHGLTPCRRMTRRGLDASLRHKRTVQVSLEHRAIAKHGMCGALTIDAPSRGADVMSTTGLDSRCPHSPGCVVRCGFLPQKAACNGRTRRLPKGC